VIITDPYELTPVMEVGGILMKRDDLFKPFGRLGVNGGKFRQCIMLVEEALKKDPGIKGLVTYNSIHSPQGAIVAATGKYYGLPSIICYGGSSERKLEKELMPRLAKKYGGEVRNISKTGRHNVLKRLAKGIAEEQGYFVVEYGINLDSFGQVLVGAVAEQVRNIPDELEHLYVTCGSGITASGILYGIQKYGKKVGRVHLISTAYDRRERVRSILASLGTTADFQYHDMFSQKGFLYDKREKCMVKGLILHPNYEAKALKYILRHDLSLDDALFWVVGTEPLV